MRIASVLALAAALGAIPALAAPPTGALGPLRVEVFDRLGVLSPLAPRKERRALERARAVLLLPAEDVVAELKFAAKVTKVLSRAFPGDAVLDPIQESAVATLGAVVFTERDALAAAAGSLPSAGAERALGKAVASADRRLGGLEGKPVWTRAALLARTCAGVERTAERLGVDLDEPEPEPPVADFSLEDVNPNSPTSASSVSPRQHIGAVSVWYFGHST